MEALPIIYIEGVVLPLLPRIISPDHFGYFVSSGVFREASEAFSSASSFQGPLEVSYAKLFPIFGENLTIHSCNSPKQITSKYSAFKRAPISNYNA